MSVVRFFPLLSLKESSVSVSVVLLTKINNDTHLLEEFNLYGDYFFVLFFMCVLEPLSSRLSKR